MAQRVVVLGVQRRAQRLEVAEVHLLDLFVEPGVLDGERQLGRDALEQLGVEFGERVLAAARQMQGADDLALGREGRWTRRCAGRAARGGRRAGLRRSRAARRRAARAASRGSAGRSRRRRCRRATASAGRGEITLAMRPFSTMSRACVSNGMSLPQLVRGRVHDLLEIEAGGRAPRDLVEEQRLLVRRLLALEQGGVLDGHARRRGRWPPPSPARCS